MDLQTTQAHDNHETPRTRRTMKFTFAPESRPLDGYTIKRAIHRGGFGEVYYAVSDSGREVALKLLQHNTDVELRGVQQCLNLSHPNLVTIFDIRQDADEDHWIIMEYVSGDTLDAVIHRHPGGMPMEQVRHWVRGIVAGMQYLHGRGIVHRDLKPANIFSEGEAIKIGDIGLSKFITHSRRSAQTQSVGTVYYMAPEVAKGRYGKEVDIYGLGVITYEMLTGELPFDGESTGEILMKHLSESPDLSKLPPRLRVVIGKALEKDPAKRYCSMQEFGTAFENAVTGRDAEPIRICEQDSEQDEPASAQHSPSPSYLTEEQAPTPLPRVARVPILRSIIGVLALFIITAGIGSPEHMAAPVLLIGLGLAISVFAIPDLGALEGPPRGRAPLTSLFGWASAMALCVGLLMALGFGALGWMEIALLAGVAAIAAWLNWGSEHGYRLGRSFGHTVGRLKRNLRGFPNRDDSASTFAGERANRILMGQHLSGAALAVPVILLLTAGGFLVAPQSIMLQLTGAPSTQVTVLAFFVVSSIIATWAILLTPVLTRLITGKEPTRRLPYAFVAIGLGVIIWLLSEFMLIQLDGYRNAAFSMIGDHRLFANGVPTAIGYIALLLPLLTVRNWRKLTTPSRDKRLSLLSVVLTVVLTFVLTRLIDFPPFLALAWGAVITIAAQLCSPWYERPARHHRR